MDSNGTLAVYAEAWFEVQGAAASGLAIVFGLSDISDRRDAVCYGNDLHRHPDCRHGLCASGLDAHTCRSGWKSYWLTVGAHPLFMRAIAGLGMWRAHETRMRTYARPELLSLLVPRIENIVGAHPPLMRATAGREASRRPFAQSA